MDRAISVLEALAVLEVATIGQLAADIGVHKSTVSRLVLTMEARGLIEVAGGRGRYRLGYGVVQLAIGASRLFELSDASVGLCRSLARLVGETVNLAVRDGPSVVNVHQEMGSSTVMTTDWIGHRHPMHATAAGKLFLAHMSRSDRYQFLVEPLEPLTPHTVTDRDELEDQLNAIRSGGFAAAIQEQVIGMTALAAPLRDAGGGVMAAVTISGPTYRIDAETLPRFAASLVVTAHDLSLAMTQIVPRCRTWQGPRAEDLDEAIT